MHNKQNEQNKLSHSFIGKQADDLSNLIREQLQPIYESLGIVVPVKSCSIIHYLFKFDGISVTDLAKKLNQSHQLVKQKLPKLQNLGLINQQPDNNDKRRTTYHLTESGQQQARLLEENSLHAVYEHLSDEINANLYQVLNDAINGLKQKDLLTRFQENNL
ncbi:MAG: MarR family transcriptional regulator [Alcanivoracaceae bacterium]|nr:MarR family transcriptional regulator [Alcanivoracaceae bacterium]